MKKAVLAVAAIALAGGVAGGSIGIPPIHRGGKLGQLITVQSLLTGSAMLVARR